MNHPLDNHKCCNPRDDRLIDRLVDGEMPEAERRELLLRFENQPDGWRRCALAFLEVQAWRQALTPKVDSVGVARPDYVKGVESPLGSPCGNGSKRSSRSKYWRPTIQFSGLAASLVVAFALGWTYHRGVVRANAVNGTTQNVEVVADGRTPVADAPRSRGRPTSVEVATNPNFENRIMKNESTETLAALNPLLKHWQQQGYSVETQPRLVSIQAKDGRTVNVPVQEVRIRYIGDRVY